MKTNNAMGLAALVVGGCVSGGGSESGGLVGVGTVEGAVDEPGAAPRSGGAIVTGSYTVGDYCDDCEVTEHDLDSADFAECTFEANGAIQARFVDRFGTGGIALDGMELFMANIYESEPMFVEFSFLENGAETTIVESHDTLFPCDSFQLEFTGDDSFNLDLDCLFGGYENDRQVLGVVAFSDCSAP